MRARRWRIMAGVVATVACLGLSCRVWRRRRYAGAASDTAAAPASDLKVGLVSDIGKFNDRSFNQSALEGLEQAEAELGVEGTPIESNAASDYIPNLTTLARDDADLTIGNGFLMADAVNTVADPVPRHELRDHRLPEAGPEGQAGQRRGLTFATNENSYLIGYMAAKMVEKQGGKQVISAVGGQEIPTVTIFLAGYEAGAKAANPDITVLRTTPRTSSQQAKCKELALDQIAKGSQVVFQVAGGCGLGALSAAEDEGRLGHRRRPRPVRPRRRTSSRAPSSASTPSVFDTIKSVQDGTLRGRRRRDLRPRERRRRARQDQPEGLAGIIDEVEASSSRSSTARSPVPTQ